MIVEILIVGLVVASGMLFGIGIKHLKKSSIQEKYNMQVARRQATYLRSSQGNGLIRKNKRS